MANELLLDTGAFVALIDRSEKRHADCVTVLDGWHGAIVTTEAVLTETLYLVGPRWQAQKVCLEFLHRGAFVLVPAKGRVPKSGIWPHACHHRAPFQRHEGIGHTRRKQRGVMVVKADIVG